MEPQKKNFKIVTDKKSARVILPNMLTLIGVCIGLTSIRFALDGRFEFAIIAIIFAALIDGLDGRIARLIKGTSKVGKELDSLTDMISFGVAPAFVMFFWKLNTLGRFGWLLCLIYVIPWSNTLKVVRSPHLVQIGASSELRPIGPGSKT